MGTYVGNTLIAGATFNPTLLDFKWTDHILNDVSWLRADTFSWQNGAVYEAAFNELFNDIYKYTTWYLEGEYLLRTYSPTPSVGDQAYLNSEPNPVPIGLVQAYDSVNNTITVNNKTYAYNSSQYVTPVTETVAGITVTYYPGTSGRKIVAYADMTAVESVYTATGVAWYYIIDTVNERFKLPRTKFGFTGLRDTVGNYVPESVPNITGDTVWNYMGYTNSATSNGALKGKSTSATTKVGATAGNNLGTAYGIEFNASDSSSTYQDGAPVQQRATQMYLYFYVGNFTPTAIQQTAGITTEELNQKVDIGHQVIEFQAPTAENGYTWYRKYADGWVEQGNCKGVVSNTTVNLPVTMLDSNYSVLVTSVATTASPGPLSALVFSQTTTSFSVQNGGGALIVWQVSGMAA